MERSISLTFKSPLGIIALIVMAVNNSFISSSIFGGIGSDQIEYPTIKKTLRKKVIEQEISRVMAKNNQIVANWLGALNFLATDVFISMSMTQVFAIPKQKNVFNRERSNNMYSTTIYFLSTWLMSTIVSCIYPLIVATMAFQYLEMEDSSLDNYLDWLRVLLI